MTWGLPRRNPLWEKKFVFWFCCILFSIAEADETSDEHAKLGVSAPHMYYTCPEGSTVKMLCAQRGTAKFPHDILRKGWFFTQHSDQHCVDRKGPRGYAHSHTVPPGVKFGSTENNFWVELQNVTRTDQGRYCCMVLDVHTENKHKSLVQRPHSHVLLQVTPRRNGSQQCTVWDPTPPGGSVPVGLAIAACILALLSLPLILVLVYKQRNNVQSSRRAQELVRMDSEALGHENPVFLGGSPQTKTRTVSQIMTRQSSETGRHLLSEPGTPFTPPIHGDVFFPIEDTILESPDFMQV